MSEQPDRHRPRCRRRHPDEVEDDEGAAPHVRAQHDRPRPGAPCRRSSPQRIVAVVGHQREQVAAHIPELVPEVGARRPGDPAGHRPRRPGRHGGRARRRPAAPSSSRTATPRCSRARPCGRSPPSTRPPSARSASCPASWRTRSATAGSSATTRATSRRSSRRRTRPASSATIREINSGILAFDAEFLTEALPKIGNDNAKGEYYLTDTRADRPRRRAHRGRATRSTT